MTIEERYQKMISAGTQPDSLAAKKIMASNETNEEAIEKFTEELIASGQNVVIVKETSEETTEKMDKLTDKEIKIELLKESI